MRLTILSNFCSFYLVVLQCIEQFWELLAVGECSDASTSRASSYSYCSEPSICLMLAQAILLILCPLRVQHVIGGGFS